MSHYSCLFAMCYRAVAVVSALCQLSALAEETQVDDKAVFRNVLRRQGDDNVHTSRIPGLVTTNNGTLVAVFDVRHKSARDLPGDIDVGVMRSTDNGTTWGQMNIVLDFDAGEPDSIGNGVGDPAVLVDRKTGCVIVVALWSKGDRAWTGSRPGLAPEETGQLVLTRSTDDGISWSRTVNITEKIAGRDPTWRLCFNGPGNGIQLRDGTLVFAAQFRDGQGVPHSCFIFSSDGGDTWEISKPAIATQPPTSEAQIAELDDGSLLINMRDESRSRKRALVRYDWNDNLANGHWSEPWFVLPDPTCMASMISHPEKLLLFSNPNSERERRSLTIRTSVDGGQTWSSGRLLDPRPSAYSSMTVLQDGSVGVLYECGISNPYETLTFARFSLDWVHGK